MTLLHARAAVAVTATPAPPCTDEEAANVGEDIWPELWPFLRPEGYKGNRGHGTSLRDIEGELVTPLINNEECAYTVIEDGIFKCGIEIAFTCRGRRRSGNRCHVTCSRSG